jgi:Trypsin-co-occurring domain 2
MNASDKPSDGGTGIGLAEAIAALRDELLKARAAGAGSDIQLPVESMTVELHVAATRSREGRAGCRVPVVDVELGGGLARGSETGQTVTVVFSAPVDRTGAAVKVAKASDELKG